MDDLSAQAKANPRLRQAFDLRTTPEDGSQRILNAVEPGMVPPIHRHRGSTETIVVLRGKVVQHCTTTTKMERRSLHTNFRPIQHKLQ